MARLRVTSLSCFSFFFFFSWVLKISIFWPQLLHEFLQHFSKKNMFLSCLRGYSFEASFLFFLIVSCFSFLFHFPNFSFFFYVFLQKCKKLQDKLGVCIMFFRLTPWILPLSALLSLVLGTSTLSELSSLGYAVPDHSSAPHNFFVLHNARVSPAAGQSLVAGVDTPPDPDVEGLIPRLGAALRPFQERSLLSRWGQRYLCSDEYEVEKPDSFLAGCPHSGCSSFTSLQEEKGHCKSPTDCGGIAAVGLNFQVHLVSKPSPSMMGKCYWGAPLWQGTRVVLQGWCDLLLRLSKTTHSPVLWVLLGARLSVRGAMDFSSFCVLVVGFGHFHAQ